MSSPRKTVSWATLQKNILWNLGLVAVQVRHADSVSGRARSGYYKIGILLSAAVVEAMVHHLLLRKVGSTGNVKTGRKECFDCSPLPQKYFLNHELAICKRRIEEIPIARCPEFHLLNEICLREKVISKRLYSKLERIRKLRNKIHIQGQTEIDRSYTRAQLDYIWLVFTSLIKLQ